MKCEKLFEVIDSLNEEYLNFLIDVCNIESPTDFKEGVDRVGDYFANKAIEKGWIVEKQKQAVSGDVVCITMNPDAVGEPVCFSGHMDTVHPVGSFGAVPVRCDDENIYGPGVLDCKGGLVASFMAMDALERCGFKARPVKLLLQSDEENGSRNSNKSTIRYIGERALGCIAFLNTEPGCIAEHVVSTKGICKFRFEITGKSEHSAACNNGASAICEAAHKIVELEKYKDPAYITCNCGLIKGGSAENTVPEFCTFTADFRFKTGEEKETIMKIVDKIANTTFIHGTSCKVVLVSSRTAMVRTEKNLLLFDKVKKIYKSNGLGDITMFDSVGGTDAADITEMGIPCLEAFGLIGDNVHKLNECARLYSLPLAAKRLASVAYCIE